MYIVMNRFRIRTGQEDAFETVWRERDTHLKGVPGFVAFQLLKGPAQEDHTLYATHTVWQSRDAFEAWTRSEAFRAAHKNARANPEIYAGPPQFEGFEAVLDQN